MLENFNEKSVENILIFSQTLGLIVSNISSLYLTYSVYTIFLSEFIALYPIIGIIILPLVFFVSVKIFNPVYYYIFGIIGGLWSLIILILLIFK